MYLHQVIPGAVNNGLYKAAVGCAHDSHFIAYASGCNIVILDGNFDRIQTISGINFNNVQVSCISCTTEAGLIAAAYGDLVCIFSPCRSFIRSRAINQKLSFEWDLSVKFKVNSPVNVLNWSPDGHNLLVAANDLQLWNDSMKIPSATFTIHDPQPQESSSECWGLKWKTTLPSKVKFIEYSPSGLYFASACEDDRILRVWYEDKECALFDEDALSYKCIYLPHPRAVTSLSWRKNSRFLYRSVISDCLLTSCADGVCRIWYDRNLIEPTDPSDDAISMKRYSRLKKKKRVSSGDISLSNVFKIRQVRLYEKEKLHVKFFSRTQSYGRFHKNVPHWLHTRKSTLRKFSAHSKNHLPRSSVSFSRTGSRVFMLPSSSGTFLPELSKSNALPAKACISPNFHLAATINPCYSNSSINGESHASQSIQIHWLNNKELHFTLMAEIMLLDIYRVCKKNTNGFFDDKRILSDAEIRVDDNPNAYMKKSLSESDLIKDMLNIIKPEEVLSNWETHENRFDQLIQDLNNFPDLVFGINPADGSFLFWMIDLLDDTSRASMLANVSLVSRIPGIMGPSDSTTLGQQVLIYYDTEFVMDGTKDSSPDLMIPSGVRLVTNHTNGTLNLWDIHFLDRRRCASVSTVAHVSRLCGHRFQLTEVRSHPLLPLLMTTSRSDTESGLIVWKVEPVSSLLSTSGGIVCLDKIYAHSPKGFSLVSWFSFTKSSCIPGITDDAFFVAFDGSCFMVYQVCNGSSGKENDKNYYSRGHVRQLGPLPDSHKFWEEAKLLFTLKGVSIVSDSKESRNPFLFYLVMLEQTFENWTYVHMWEIEFHCLVDTDANSTPVTFSSKRIPSQRLPVPQACGTLVSAAITSCFMSSAFLSLIYVTSIHCATAYNDGTIWLWTCFRNNRQFVWKVWNSQVNPSSDYALRVNGKPLAIKCAYSGRLVVVYMPSQSKQFSYPSSQWTVDMRADVYESESTGGLCWNLEDRIAIPDIELPKISDTDANVLPTFGRTRRFSIVDFRQVHPRARKYSLQCNEVFLGKLVPTRKLVYIDWGPCGDGSHVLTFTVGDRIFLYLWNGNSKRWEKFRSARLNTHDGLYPLPVKVKWIRDGLLLVGLHTEMQLFSPWLSNKNTNIGSSVASSVYESDAFGTYSLWMSANKTNPVLPQYHPAQLEELVLSGRISWVRDILTHLYKCLRTVSDPGKAVRRHTKARITRSRTMSINANFDSETEELIAVERVRPSYVDIQFLPPVPLCALLNTTGAFSEESNVRTQSSLFDDDDEDVDTYDFLNRPTKRHANEPTLNLSSLSSSTAMSLIEYLSHFRLPGLTFQDQMSLSAIIGTLALSDTSNQGTIAELDECGLRFLFLLRRFVYLSKTKGDVDVQALPSCALVWAFHSESQQEILNAIPCIRDGNPIWNEVKRFGIGWWLRSDQTLTEICDKITKTTYQQTGEPLDVAPFYLAMNKKSVVASLLRLKKETRLSEFFKRDFTDPANIRSAEKNGYVLIAKHRFLHSLAFFILSGNLKNVIEVCTKKLGDMQLALVLLRLISSFSNKPENLRELLEAKILGINSETSTLGLEVEKKSDDPFYRSMAYWILNKYTAALATLRHIGSSKLIPKIYNFYSYLCKHPIVVRTLERSVSLNDREAYFKVAYFHLCNGCPLVALDALLRLKGTSCLKNDSFLIMYKYICCLKIFIIELRALATGFEVSGGNLRYYLFHWLEQAIIILSEICDYTPLLTSTEEPFRNNGHNISENSKYDPKINQLRYRRLWLKTHDLLLRTILAYCSLHSGEGADGTSLEPIKLVIIFLLIESHGLLTQKNPTLPSLITIPLSYPSLFWSSEQRILGPLQEIQSRSESILMTLAAARTIPSLFSSVASRLSNLKNEALALSDCIFLCLSDSETSIRQHQDTYVALSEFTRSVKVKNSAHKALQDSSFAELDLPTSHPADWPAVNIISALLNSDTKRNILLNVRVLLFQSLVACYLALLTHALAFYDSVCLVRILSKPWNEALWSSVFGGAFVKDERVLPDSDFAGNDSEKRYVMNEKDGHSINIKHSDQFVPPCRKICSYFDEESELSDNVPKVNYLNEDEQAGQPSACCMEHRDSKSYSWRLMRYAILQLSCNNISNFLKIAGLDSPDVASIAPFLMNCLSALNSWRKIACEILAASVKPPDYMSHCVIDMSAPTPLEKYRSVFDSNNTPFCHHAEAIPVIQLWNTLLAQKSLYHIFLTHLFNENANPEEDSQFSTSKNQPNHSESALRLIYKDQDYINYFVFSQLDPNIIAFSTTKEIIEMDITHIIKCSPAVFSEKEFDIFSLNKPQLDKRLELADFLLIRSAAKLSPYVDSNFPESPSRTNLLGVRHYLKDVKVMCSHPYLPHYACGLHDGSAVVAYWGRTDLGIQIRPPNSFGAVNKIAYNSEGHKVGIADSDGILQMYQLSNQSVSLYSNFSCHSKQACDFVFLNSSTFIATAGMSADDNNVVLWDLLAPTSRSCISSFQCHEGGALCLIYAPNQNTIISSGRKGDIILFDVRQRKKMAHIHAHETAIRTLCCDSLETIYVSGSSEGNIKVWKMLDNEVVAKFYGVHARPSLIRGSTTGVTHVHLLDSYKLISSGYDGSLVFHNLEKGETGTAE